jgi:hypothetical protein
LSYCDSTKKKLFLRSNYSDPFRHFLQADIQSISNILGFPQHMRTPSAEHLCRFSSGTNISLSAAGEERVPANSVIMTEFETPALSSRGGMAGQYEPFAKQSGGVNSATSSSTDEAAQAIKVERPLKNNPAVTGILRIMFPLNDFIEECLQLIPFYQQSVYSLSTWVSQLVRTRG